MGYLLGDEKYSSFCSPLPCNVKDTGMINGILVVMLCREFNVRWCFAVLVPGENPDTQ